MEKNIFSISGTSTNATSLESNFVYSEGLKGLRVYCTTSHFIKVIVQESEDGEIVDFEEIFRFTSPKVNILKMTTNSRYYKIIVEAPQPTTLRLVAEFYNKTEKDVKSISDVGYYNVEQFDKLKLILSSRGMIDTPIRASNTIKLYTGSSELGEENVILPFRTQSARPLSSKVDYGGYFIRDGSYSDYLMPNFVTYYDNIKALNGRDVHFPLSIGVRTNPPAILGQSFDDLLAVPTYGEELEVGTLIDGSVINERLTYSENEAYKNLVDDFNNTIKNYTIYSYVELGNVGPNDSILKVQHYNGEYLICFADKLNNQINFHSTADNSDSTTDVDLNGRLSICLALNKASGEFAGEFFTYSLFVNGVKIKELTMNNPLQYALHLLPNLRNSKIINLRVYQELLSESEILQLHTHDDNITALQKEEANIDISGCQFVNLSSFVEDENGNEVSSDLVNIQGILS